MHDDGHASVEPDVVHESSVAEMGTSNEMFHPDGGDEPEVDGVPMTEALARASAHFRRPAAPSRGGRLSIDGLEYLYDPRHHPPFVLVPECDVCANRVVEQFSFEVWTIDGVQVRAQTRTTCRDCRFLAVCALDAPLSPELAVDLAAEPKPPDGADRWELQQRGSPGRARAKAFAAADHRSRSRASGDFLLVAALVLLTMAITVAGSRDLEVWSSTSGRVLGSAVAVISLTIASIGLIRAEPLSARRFMPPKRTGRSPEAAR